MSRHGWGWIGRVVAVPAWYRGRSSSLVETAEKGIDVDLWLTRMLLLLWLGAGGSGSKRSEKGLQCRVIDLACHTGDILSRETMLGWLGCGGWDLGIAGVTRWRHAVLRRIHVLLWRIRVWRICWLRRCLCMLGPEDNLCRHNRVEVLVLIEADIVDTSRAVEDAERDLALVLSGDVELDDSMHTFEYMSLQQQVSGEARVEEHGIGL
jgi:hypothetical protein